MNAMERILKIAGQWFCGFAPGIVCAYVADALLAVELATGNFLYDAVLLFVEGKFLTWAGEKFLRRIWHGNLPRVFYSAAGILCTLLLCWVGCFVKGLLSGTMEIYFPLVVIVLGILVFVVAVIKKVGEG